MRRLADITLALLQWALVVIGLLTVLVTLVSYRTDASYFASLPQVPPGADTYYVVSRLRWVFVGITSGLIAIGLGAALFYLRRSYLARRGT